MLCKKVSSALYNKKEHTKAYFISFYVSIKLFGFVSDFSPLYLRFTYFKI